MVVQGETAPTFSVPMAGGGDIHDVSCFRLDEAISDGPVVLAFYPAAFSGGCTAELCAFRDSLETFESLSVGVYGVSVDLPYAQNAWILAEELGIPMLSDWNHEVIDEYDVVREDVAGSVETARRSVFVVDSERTVRYRWVQQGDLPDFADLVVEVEEAVRPLVSQ